MSDFTRISVITVVRNGARHLEETIRSVVELQPQQKLDYLVIDGGSTDGTVDIIRRYADRISYWVTEQDGGVYDAMNKGWAAAADGSFILFLGAGDRLISLPVEMCRYDCNDVVCGSVYMGGKCIFTPKAGYHLKLYNSLHHQAVLVNKALHPTPPFNINYSLYADFDFNQRLMKSRARFIFSPQFAAYACPGGLSDQKRFTESLRIIRHNYGALWALLALGGWTAMKMFPVLKRLRPFRAV